MNQVLTPFSNNQNFLYPLVCLIGMHGTGKTTIGQILKNQCGFQHLSVGSYVRAAKNNLIPSDVPYRLISELRQHKSGGILSEKATLMLLEHIKTILMTKPVSLDGFPSSPEHIALLPATTHFVVVECDENTRTDRLIERGNKTVRKWIEGQSSQRDLLLDNVQQEIKNQELNFHQINNNGDLSRLQNEVMKLPFCLRKGLTFSTS